MFLLDQNGKKVIHEIKYHGVKDVLKDLPRWLDRCGNYREFIEDSILVPVPLHKKRLKTRGFNQSSWIAGALVKEMGGRVVVSEVLTRVRDTPTQTKFDRSERQKNVKKCFCTK